MPLRPDPEILRKTAIFRSLDESDFKALVMCLRVREVDAGGVLFQEGDPGDSMMIVDEGTLVATVRRKDGGEHELNRMGQGEVIGEMAFLDTGVRSATVIVLASAHRVQIYDDRHRRAGSPARIPEARPDQLWWSRRASRVLPE